MKNIITVALVCGIWMMFFWFNSVLWAKNDCLQNKPNEITNAWHRYTCEYETSKLEKKYLSCQSGFHDTWPEGDGFECIKGLTVCHICAKNDPVAPTTPGAWVVCDPADVNKVSCPTSSQCDCSPNPDWTTECLPCKSDDPSCYPPSVLVDNWMWSKSCCDTGCQALRASMPCGKEMNSKLAWKSNAIVSKSGIWCVCKPGFKNVNNECKPCNAPWVCCGIELNTNVPFIGKCIEDGSVENLSPDETKVTSSTAFPVLMWSLTKILVTIILIVSFVLIIIGGIMIATGDPGWGKKMIMKVVVGIALLGASGVILRLINPNFFG